MTIRRIKRMAVLGALLVLIGVVVLVALHGVNTMLSADGLEHGQCSQAFGWYQELQANCRVFWFRLLALASFASIVIGTGILVGLWIYRIISIFRQLRSR